MNNIVSSDTLTTSGPTDIKSGQYIDIYSISGEAKHTLKVASVSGSVIQYRTLKWYESLWLKVRALARRIRL